MGKKYSNSPTILKDTNKIGAADNSAIQILKDNFFFNNAEPVLDFIDKHPYLIEILLETPQIINSSRYFPDAKLVLQLFIDPETTGISSLVIVIISPFKPKETLERLDLLEDEWWLQAEETTKGNLSINVRYY